MLGLVLYLMVSIVVGTALAKITLKVTDLSNFGSVSRALFLLYFCVGNILAWPIFILFSASAYLHDEITL